MPDPNLTEREIEVVRLRDEDKLMWREIAARLGTTKGSVNTSYRQAMAKIDRAANPKAHQKEPNAQGNTVEVKKPGETAEFLDSALEPFASIGAAAEECGFPPSTAKRLMKRMAARYKPLHDSVKSVKDEEMVLLLEDRARRCLEYADDFSMAGASLRDLMVSAGIGIDKARLLKGEPTVITRVEDVKKLDEVWEMLAAEALRRGLIKDITPEKPGDSVPQAERRVLELVSDRAGDVARKTIEDMGGE